MIALIGGVPGFFSIKNELSKQGLSISYDARQSLVGTLASDKKERFGKEVIAFYALSFVGGDVPATIKNIQLFIKTGWWTWDEAPRIDLYPIDFHGFGNAVVGNATDTIVFVGWKNFEPSSLYYIERGKTLPFNVAFMSNLSKDQIKKSTKWQVVITDFSGSKFTTIIEEPKFVHFPGKWLFDCYLKYPGDVQEIMKENLTYANIQKYLTNKYGHRMDYYDK